MTDLLWRSVMHQIKRQTESYLINRKTDVNRSGITNKKNWN